MTKTTKVFATLGVVAGLGVAALPLGGVFAAPAEVSGEVELYVDVKPAIAMTITGNNDNGTAPGDNAPVQVKDPSGATTIDGVNVSTYAVGTQTKASSSYLSILPNAVGSMTSTVTVYTNNVSGFTLQLKDKDSTTALTGSSPMTDTIPASATTAAGTAAWSVQSDAGTGIFANATAITGSDQTVKTTSTKTHEGDATTMTYTVSTKADQETGLYSDTIVYTATTNS